MVKNSADQQAADDFKPQLTKLMEDSGLTLEQVYNADETGLF